jgi:hypothetical protein
MQHGVIMPDAFLNSRRLRRDFCTFGCTLVLAPLACNGSGDTGAGATGESDAESSAAHSGSESAPAGRDGSADGSADGAHAVTDAAAAVHEASSDGHVSAVDGGVPSGWLYTRAGKIYLSQGQGPASDPQWMGRGVNMDDIFLCGYDNNLDMQSQSPSAEQTLETLLSEVVSDWKANFVRISLSMNTFPTKVSWLTNPAQYRTPMTNAIQTIGSRPNVYALVTLRTDASMTGQDPGNPEATAVPSNANNTPDPAQFPTGTDAVYQALVDTFANSGFVLFGVSNEPGGNLNDQSSLAAAMSHAVGVIRAEEDKLGVPHHLVSVQGTAYTSTVAFWAQAPLPFDNVVYEVHRYPPPPESYTYNNIPVIIGEYGSLSDATSFYADVEAKKIPNLAWDFEPFSDCAPDLLNVNESTTLSPSVWGNVVKSYLTSHAH